MEMVETILENLFKQCAIMLAGIKPILFLSFFFIRYTFFLKKPCDYLATLAFVSKHYILKIGEIATRGDFSPS